MTNLKMKKFAVVILAVTMAFGLGACNMDYDRGLTRGYNTPDGLAPYANDYDNRYGLNDRNNRFNGDYMYRGMGGNRFNVTDANAEAERLAEKAVRVRGVEDATVVITGRTAYVAIDLADKIQSQEADRIEREVYRTLAKNNRYRIAITSDEDLFGRLRDIGDGVRNGTPVERYQRDLDNMGDRFINRNTTNHK